jgi:hypothetical protein
MGNEEVVAAMSQGASAWNAWRRSRKAKQITLSRLDLDGEIFNVFNFEAVTFLRCSMIKTNLFGSVLAGAIFDDCDLRLSDLGKVDCSGASFRNARMNNANLVHADASGCDFSDANLQGANFRSANLRHSRFASAKLVEADLTNANITGANFWGSTREGWRIDGILCDFIFWDRDSKQRFPKNRKFGTTEFFERYQQLPTFECVFENGIAAFDAVVVNKIVNAINERKPEFDLKIDSFHSRGFPHVKFTVKHQAFAEEAESIIIKEYETQVRMLEDQRDRLEEYFKLAISQPRIAQETVMGDQYINNGQSGVVGPNGEARDFQQAQTVNRVVDPEQLSILAEELSRLRKELKHRSDHAPEQDVAIAAIAKAEVAAGKGDEGEVTHWLSQAGKWALDVATELGVAVAAAAITKAITG